jgi:hypothetical protein
MKINERYQIDKAVSDDHTRPALMQCHLDREKARLVACDGKIMAVVPVTDLDGSPGDCPKDSSGPVSVDALKAARRLKSPYGLVLGASGKHSLANGATMPRPNDLPSYPPYEQVLPGHRMGSPDTITICINAELLLDLAKAIGNTVKSGTFASLTFPIPSREESVNPETGHKDMLDPIAVKGFDGAIGVIMPCRP